MSDYIIKVENLGKKYKILHQQERQNYVALRDVIANKAVAPLRWLANQTSAFRSQKSAVGSSNGVAHNCEIQNLQSEIDLESQLSPNDSSKSDIRNSQSEISSPLALSPLQTSDSSLPASDSAALPLPLSSSPGEEDFWALQGVSFEVKQGEVVGIIGRNGAGKSTLLKILSRITKPTEGCARIRGRVASLLEVGTGFHPELTGRENIFLNGAVLGMTREEIKKKFDEIVAFAEVEQFLDTPVKRYSSGMYVRLAFAVAAHLEPEILVVDEVLAVGDIVFQRKCLKRMKSIADRGRTVLFVSHNLAAIGSLCTRALWLANGAIKATGRTSEVINLYHDALASKSRDRRPDLRNAERYGNGKAKFISALVDCSFAETFNQQVFYTADTLKVVLQIHAERAIFDANVAMTIFDSSGYRLVDANSALKGNFLNLNANDTRQIAFELNCLLLKPGEYVIGLWLGREGIEEIDSISCAITLSIEQDPKKAQHTQVYPGPYQCAFNVLGI